MTHAQFDPGYVKPLSSFRKVTPVQVDPDFEFADTILPGQQNELQIKVTQKFEHVTPSVAYAPPELKGKVDPVVMPLPSKRNDYNSAYTFQDGQVVALGPGHVPAKVEWVNVIPLLNGKRLPVIKIKGIDFLAEIFFELKLSFPGAASAWAEQENIDSCYIVV